MAAMVLSASAVIDMINGRWRSQILYAGVELGVFERLSDNAARSAESIAREIGADLCSIACFVHSPASTCCARIAMVDFRSPTVGSY